jgi:hypothetical protein
MFTFSKIFVSAKTFAKMFVFQKVFAKNMCKTVAAHESLK